MIVGLLTQATTNFKGQYYQLSDARNEPKPVQRPHPPICVGGSGERRTLRTAARFAQHWNFVGGTPEEFARKRGVLHEHCEDLGRDPREILLSSHVRFAGDAKATSEQAAALAEVGADLGIVYLPPPLDPGVLEPLATALRELLRRRRRLLIQTQLTCNREGSSGAHPDLIPRPAADHPSSLNEETAFSASMSPGDLDGRPAPDYGSTPPGPGL